jgi:hypothetical protein
LIPQTAKDTKDQVSTDIKPDFSDDHATNTVEQASKTTYKSLGQEACAKLTCYKYKVIDSSAPDDNEFIWFDTKDYQLRKLRHEDKDGGVSEQTYSYDKISIVVPSPVKELGPTQYIIPGQNEPVTAPDVNSVAPDAGSVQQYLNSIGGGAAADTSTDDSEQ